MACNGLARIAFFVSAAIALSFVSASAAEQLTDNNVPDVYSPVHPPNVGDRILWFQDGKSVYYYDGASTVPVQTLGQDPNLDTILDTVFGMGTGASAAEVIGGWRRLDNSTWIWTSGNAPVELDTASVNPVVPATEMNAEALALADGCAFMVMQANDGVTVSLHVFQVDPLTGAMQLVSDGRSVYGATRVRSDQCQAVWIYDPNNNAGTTGLPLELQFFDGSSTTTLDSGELKLAQFDLHEGKVLYIKTVGGTEQVLLYDVTTPVPAPRQLSTGDRRKYTPQTDGRHVAWGEEAVGGRLDIILLGGINFTPFERAKPLADTNYPFQLDRGQMTWETSIGELYYAAGGDRSVVDISPAQGVERPRLSDGWIAFYGRDGGVDTEIFLHQGAPPEDMLQPSPPMWVEAEMGYQKVTLYWDEVLGATSYNVYYAEVPGVTSQNYAGLAGGATVQNAQSPLVIDGLDHNLKYTFVVTSVEDGVEGPDSSEATTDTIVVTTTLDDVEANPGDGVCETDLPGCSLRAAISEADALDRKISVVVPPGTYTIGLLGDGDDGNLEGDLDIRGRMTIAGAGNSQTTIDGNSSERVIHVDPLEEGLDVTIAELTVTGALQGIQSRGNLELRRVAILNNGNPNSSVIGAAVESQGETLRMVDSLAFGNQTGSHGGGLVLSGPAGARAVIERTAIASNLAGIGGGGIYVFRNARATIIDSTININSSRNQQDWGGGGLAIEGKVEMRDSVLYLNESPDCGGGAWVIGGELTLVNTTVTGNTADSSGGGICAQGGAATVDLRNVTFGSNNAPAGSGVAATGGATATAQNTIFYQTGNDTTCVGVTSLGNNLDSGNTCNLGPGELINTDPLLDMIEFYGGRTLNHALLPGSPAIDAGDPAGCLDQHGLPITTDQRGGMRPFDGDGVGGPRCDIGSYEELGPCLDDDADGFPAMPNPICWGADEVLDCDDTSAAIFPGATQLCDGLNNDCDHPEWPAIDGTNEIDTDGDGLSGCDGDCLANDGEVWGTPGEVRDLHFSDPQSLNWAPPLDPGATLDALGYDAASALDPQDWSVGAVCLGSSLTSPQTTDATDDPTSGQVFFYVVRAVNACPSGMGSWGNQSSGVQRQLSICP